MSVLHFLHYSIRNIAESTALVLDRPVHDWFWTDQFMTGFFLHKFKLLIISVMDFGVT